VEVSRRDFLKISLGTVFLSAPGLDLKKTKAYAKELELKIKGAQETLTICPYCSLGCGIIVYTKEGRVVNTEGDPNHPINQGAFCPMRASLFQFAESRTG
jgi:formate dehydrogenase major subunit